MSLIGKVEGGLLIKSSATDFHDYFRGRPHHVSNATPEKVQGCELHEGEFGSVGSIICWSYVHDGKNAKAKQVIEAIDDENNSTTFKMIEGDLLDLYKNMTIFVGATPKEDGSLVYWVVDYEKLNENVPDPNTLLELFFHITKDIDEHIQK